MHAANGTSRDSAYAAARRAMVRQQLERRNITNSRLLDAMREVPRHVFVPPEWRADAYSDRPLPIGEDQTISQPYMVALMIQELALSASARVLEVGTGSGYQAAVLSRLALRVYTIEYFPTLAAAARATLLKLGYGNVEVIVGDGGLGLPEHAPYDGIIVAAAAPHIPEALCTQLAEGGRLVIPVGTIEGQELRVIAKRDATVTERYGVPCRFVPLLGREGWRRSP